MYNSTIEAKKALLKINPHALQGLHNLVGYDFEQRHTIRRIEGRFTVNSALKAVGTMDGEKKTVSILCMDHGCTWRDRLSLVTIEMNGATARANIEHKGGYKWGIDNYNLKSYFEDTRKSEKAEAFIIAQTDRYIKIPTEKTFDPFARYEYIPGKDSKCGDGHGASWIERITARALDGSNRTMEITKDGHKYRFSNIVYRRQDENKPQNRLEIIDKSGYILPERRAELSRKADKLRKDRAKAAYQATDNRAKVEELRAMIEAKKAEFSASIANAADSEALRTIAHELYFKFLWTVAEFERFADKTNRRDYVSIQAAENAYNHIKQELTKEA